jgi:PAS domain S-box-containing protein
MKAQLRPRAADPFIFGLLTGSFAKLVGRSLVPEHADPDWLYEEAPFAVLAHDTSDDPRFFYANRAAQACFGYSWIEFIGMPSRLSAETPERAARQLLLQAVARDGYVSDYRGVRIAKSGRRFWIEQAVVWELLDADGVRRGQAACFERWVDLAGRC